jgi:hypothetical protein
VEYSTLRTAVRKYSTDPQNSPYDFNGVVQLMLAALDNLREFAFEEELADIGYVFNSAQREFLGRILDYSYGVPDESSRKGDD